jgi:hypothetical protein
MEELLRSQAAGMGFVVVVLVVGFIGSAIWFRRMRAARATSTREAAAHGLRYFPEDPFGLERLGLPLFEEADGLEFTNLLIGDWDGLPFKAAEVKWTKERGGVIGEVADAVMEVGKWTEEREYTLLVAELDLRIRMPWVVVTPHSLLSKAKSAVGLGGIPFEHGREFNSLFQVRAEDSRFAYQLLSPAMMAHLVQQQRVPWRCPRCGKTHMVLSPDRMRYEVSGSRLLVALPRTKSNVTMQNVYPLFAAAKGFVERIPQPGWSQHGAAAVGGER